MSTSVHFCRDRTPALNDYLPTLARLLMCSLFIWDGVLQLRDPAGTVEYFTSLHVPTPRLQSGSRSPIHLLGGWRSLSAS